MIHALRRTIDRYLEVGPVHFFLDRVWPLTAALAVLTVLATSAVGVNLWVLTGYVAEAVAVGYAAALLGLVAAPDHLGVHRICIGLGAIYWGGRAAAFATLVAGGRPDLAGAVAERILIAVLVVTLHLVAARRVGFLAGITARRA